MGCCLEGSCRLVSLSQNGLSSHSLALAGDTSKRLCAPFREPRRTSLYSEEKEPSGAGMGSQRMGPALGGVPSRGTHSPAGETQPGTRAPGQKTAAGAGKAGLV